jgi:glutathione S-transferase
VPLTLPRPQISDLLGVGYRRIPVLAIGNDLYCDTSLITSVLERRFPESEGYPTLFPRRKRGGSTDTGLIKALVMFYVDRVVFPLLAPALPFKKFSESFLKDRSDVCLLFSLSVNLLLTEFFSILASRSMLKHLRTKFRD